MSDIYVRDTTKALEEADSLFVNILTELQDDYKDHWDTLYLEISGLIEQYNKLLEERDKLLIKVKELEGE